MPAVLGRVNADKQFIANLAKKGVTSCAENCVISATAVAIIESINSKNLNLSEFATGALNSFAKFAGKNFYEQH